VRALPNVAGHAPANMGSSRLTSAYLQELCQLAYVVGRAYLSLALSLGVLLVVPKAIGDKEHEY